MHRKKTMTTIEEKRFTDRAPSAILRTEGIRARSRYEPDDKVDTMKHCKTFGLLNLGTFFFALAYYLFFEPLNIAPGGLGGLAVVVGSLTGLSFGALNIAMNLPGVLLGFRFLGGRRIVMAAYAVFVSSLLIDWGAAMFAPPQIPLLLAAVLGGLCQGLGVGILIAIGGSVGGTALLGQLMQLRLPNVSLGRLFLIMDGVIVLFSLCVFGDLWLFLAAMLSVFLSTQVIDYCQGQRSIRLPFLARLFLPSAKADLDQAA